MSHSQVKFDSSTQILETPASHQEKTKTFHGKLHANKGRQQQIVNAQVCYQELSEYGFVYGSKLWKCQFSVDSQLRTQLRTRPASKVF